MKKLNHLKVYEGYEMNEGYYPIEVAIGRISDLLFPLVEHIEVETIARIINDAILKYAGMEVNMGTSGAYPLMNYSQKIKNARSAEEVNEIITQLCGQ